MITNVSIAGFKPSFGLAKLSPQGLGAAQAFGYPTNTFLDSALFTKQKGRIKNTALGQTLARGFSLEQIVTSYGCTDNPSANADFIKNCILSKKGQRVIKNVNSDDKTNALLTLWDKNYDNPDLSVKDTKALLELIKDDIEPHVYVQNQGMLTGAK